jgi:tRNA(Ile2)-agmatinylcytidine synthase
MHMLHVAFDDTDSREGRCTTHLAFKIVDHLKKKQLAQLVDFPLLIDSIPISLGRLEGMVQFACG